MPEYVRVASASELAPGQVKEVTANGKTLALCNVEGTYYALDNACLHRGGPLGEGTLEGDKIECPWHAWRFDVKSGCAGPNPQMKLATYEVKVEGGDVLVAV